MAFAWVYFSPMMSNLNLSLPPAILATMVLIWLLLYCLLKPLGPTTSTSSVLAVSFCSMATKLSLLSPVISSLLGSLGSTPTETLRQSRSSRASRAKRQRCFRVLVMCVMDCSLEQGLRLSVGEPIAFEARWGQEKLRIAPNQRFRSEEASQIQTAPSS